MTTQEFATISAAIRAAWPSANIMPDRQSKEVWWTMLADLDYKPCLMALKEHMSTCKFPPSIAELREKTAGMTQAPVRDWGEAWEDVKMAIRFKGMYREQEALEQLDEITQKCVRRLGFQSLCTSENETADRANFRMIYEQEQRSQMTFRQLPPALQEQKRKLQQLTAETVKRLEG
ncbi:hypothetical protein KE540_01385 [Lachnospiraceae bacterium Marseille-Q4251]|nr:hypothetical protein [Lachnospiraceae bacterium Marseille-Q4251]